MGTRGFRAYRYKNRYYRVYNHWDSYPSGLGTNLIRLIPRDPILREVWVKRLEDRLESLAAWRHENGISDSTAHETPPSSESNPNSTFAEYADKEPLFTDILDSSDWIFGDIMIEWTYVIDLDYRAFSVNGQTHFNLDNMPSPDEFEGYYRYQLIPGQHLTSVLYWPTIDCDAETTNAHYNDLQPRILHSDDWGTPSWTSLSVAQHFSVQLVKTIVSDYQGVLASPDLSIQHHKILLICWQVACAAAPSHVVCPAKDSSMPQDALHASVTYDYFDHQHNKQAVPCRINSKGFTRVYCWFRGCLLRFSLRLDHELLFRNEINEMVRQLTKDGRSGGVGIIMSSNQLLAVAVDGSVVRHSPLLDFHDAKGEVKDGLLLLVHLLGPTVTAQKTPWTETAAQTIHDSSILPEDVIRSILHFTDDQTYVFILPSVSRLIRSICLGQPRFGGLFITAVHPDGTYQALSSSNPTIETRVKLVRAGKVLDKELRQTFQHRQIGIGYTNIDIEATLKELQKNSSSWDVPELQWNAMVRGDELPNLRVQVVEGAWQMVEVGTATAAKTENA